MRTYSSRSGAGRWRRYNLIILNEVGYVPFVQVVAELLFEPSSPFVDGDNFVQLIQSM